MRYIFSTADKRMFSTAQKILGGPAEEILLSRLVDDVSGDEWGFVDAAFLRKAGMDELSMLSDVLGPGCNSEEPVPSARVVLSLRAILFDRDDSALDLELRAGLHRLGRATADLDVASLWRITRDLPAAWVRCVKAAWFRLSRLEECRASAATLRDLLTNGDRK